MATYTYKGTAITGTKTTAKVFKKSGVKNAKVNDTYLNKQTGHVYKCTVAGEPDTAKWQYVRTDIIGTPDITVSGITKPARNAYIYKTKWTIPGKFAKATNGRRATRLVVDWYLGIKGKDPRMRKDYADETATEKQCNLNNFTAQDKTYTRASFYPATDLKLTYLTCKVAGENAKGIGKYASSTLEFKKPRNPVISNPVINASTGEVSVTITTDAGADARERYDTRYIVTYEDTHTGETKQHLNSYTTNTSKALAYDPSDYQELEYDEYIRVTFEAWARGFAGDSDHVKKQYTVAFPAKVTITSHTAIRSSAGKATFFIKTNSTKDHPVDQVRLEYLANTEYMDADSIPGDASWTSTDIVDDAQSTALTMPVTNLIPDAGKRTWVRVKSYHGIEAVLHRYSEPVYLDELETVPATAVDDSVTILSAVSGDDGKSAVVVMGWNADGTDDSTGTEVTWSDDKNAWKSTDEPEQFDFTWSDGAKTSGNVTYQDSAELTIKGLDEGIPVYIRARRYLNGDTTTYGGYSDTAAVTPNVAPYSVVLDAPTYVPIGSSIPFTWTYGGGGTQRAWQLLTSTGTVIAQGENAMGSYNLSAERANALAVNGVLTVYVAVATGADFVRPKSIDENTGLYVDENTTIRIVSAPTLSVTVPQTLTAQPAAFTATSNRECALMIVVSAVGASGQTPLGVEYQPEGETVWSGVLYPAWTLSNNAYTASVTLPSGLDLIDPASYTVSVTALDESTGLTSDVASGVFDVNWTHKAPAPGDYVEVTPNDTTDDDGIRHLTATIAWNIPTTVDSEPFAASTDVVDIYRLTGDGATLIGSNYGLEASVTDEYAPFGDSLTNYYRIALRSVDGSVNFSDVEYALGGDMMRFDWVGGVLELPYDITLSDSYSKDKTARKHLDGTTNVYYNSGVTRTGKQTSRLVRLKSQETIELVRALARYAGNVFVRLPDGCAYEACVEIDDISTTGVISSFSIATTEAATTQAFMLPIPAVEPEGETS